MITESGLMDVADTASYIGLSVFTVRRLAKLKKIPAAKVGRSYRFKKDDIDSYVRGQYSVQFGLNKELQGASDE